MNNVTKLKSSSDMFAELDSDPKAEPWADQKVDMPKDFKGRLYNAHTAMTYIMAGHATITIRSTKTGTRFTYKINQSKPDENGNYGPRGPVHFVSLMIGPDNESSFKYLGHIFPTQMLYWHGRKSKISADAPGAKAFDWTWRQLSKNKLPDQLEIWHEGSCGRCGRKLTVPESVASGFGPECRNHV